MTFEVAPKSAECFYEELGETGTIDLKFEVIRGGLLDIRLTVKAPNGNNLYENIHFFNHDNDDENEKEGLFLIHSVGSGLYTICFDNTMSRWTPKIVTVKLTDDFDDLFSEDIEKLEKEIEENEAKVATIEKLGPVVEAVIKISEKMDKMKKLQHNLRVKEQYHRDLQEASNSRVQWLAIVEAFVLIVLTIFRTRFVRNWFEENKHRRIRNV